MGSWGLRFSQRGLRFSPWGLRFSPWGLRASLLGLRFRNTQLGRNHAMKYTHGTVSSKTQ